PLCTRWPAICLNVSHPRPRRARWVSAPRPRGVALLGGPRLDRRLPRPRDDERFACARPRLDRRADRRERPIATVAELQRGPHRNRDADAGRDGHDLRLVARVSPHLALTQQEIPGLRDRAVPARDRSLTCGQLKVSKAAASDPEENAYVGSVGGDDISVRR